MSRRDQPGIHLYGIGGDFKGFDPIDAGNVESADQVYRVYEGLLEYAYLDRPYRAIPRLAEALPKVSADGLTYTFKIKPGIRFQDDPCFPDGKGRELVAEDFVYSFKRLLDSKLQSQGYWIFSDFVVGANDWMKKNVGRESTDRLFATVVGICGARSPDATDSIDAALSTTPLGAHDVLRLRRSA